MKLENTPHSALHRRLELALHVIVAQQANTDLRVLVCHLVNANLVFLVMLVGILSIVTTHHRGSASHVLLVLTLQQGPLPALLVSREFRTLLMLAALNVCPALVAPALATHGLCPAQSMQMASVKTASSLHFQSTSPRVYGSA